MMIKLSDFRKRIIFAQLLPKGIPGKSYFIFGVMLEWLKRHAWKACNRLKRFGGSNPPYSAQI